MRVQNGEGERRADGQPARQPETTLADVFQVIVRLEARVNEQGVALASLYQQLLEIARIVINLNREREEDNAFLIHKLNDLSGATKTALIQLDALTEAGRSADRPEASVRAAASDPPDRSRHRNRGT